MRPVKVENKQLIEGLFKVFREKGYEGASLNELAEKAGLKKASLYHRFPEGKKQIGMAVLLHSSEWLHTNLYQLLADKNIAATERLEMALSRISELYNQGKETCILRSLSMESGMQIFGEEIKGEMNRWIKYFAQLGLDFGFTEEEALKKGKESLVKVQGSLIVANAMSDTDIFVSSLAEIRELFDK
ncbi:TetR/AcrR family transcriptional regulator [Aquimarina sp. AU474]|uniref:TetR/AcrR family transcriptional regulator n=1 Tax=Aquimarina sp. AU474 TaxID=2108529 RepID=UPI000D695FA3|nr:TetR/AcrR family transcriptional regulator [Aquimarina sp. AU474]